MIWIRVMRDWDWHTHGPCRLCKFVTWAFRGGTTVRVPAEAADAAVSAGVAHRVEDRATWPAGNGDSRGVD